MILQIINQSNNDIMLHNFRQPPASSVRESARERAREYEQECVVNETRAETGAPCTHLSALHTQF